MSFVKQSEYLKRIQSIIIKGIILYAMTVAIFCTPVFAGNFNISLSMTTHYTPNHLEVDIGVTNRGSAPAYGTNITLTALKKSITHGKQPDILAGKSFTFSFIIPHENLKPGSYPAFAVCRFRDTNEYTFTALHASTFKVDAQCDQLITADLDGVSIKKDASVALRLQNHGETPLKAVIQVVLPYEFSAIKKYSAILPPQSTHHEIFEINNLHALSGASYPFFCIIEYDIDECHQTLIANNILRVGKISTDSLFYPVRWYLLMGFAVILFVIFFTGLMRTFLKNNS